MLTLKDFSNVVHNEGEKVKVKDGLDDYIADASIMFHTTGEIIPCKVGYIEFDDGFIFPRRVYVKECISNLGNHYYDSTIDIGLK